MLTWYEVHAQQCEDKQIECAVIVLDARHGAARRLPASQRRTLGSCRSSTY